MLDKGTMLDEVDFALIDALQVSPRASWTVVGEVLGLAPVTLARRWQRLVENGEAWLSISHSNASARGAILELVCEPGAESAVAEMLALSSMVSTVGITTGEYQVYANIVTASIADTARLLLGGLPLPDGVIRVRSHVFGSLFGGMSWRLGVLSEAHADRLRAPREIPTRASRPFDPADRALFRALGVDGRRSCVDLAAELGTTPCAVQRRIGRLERGGEVAFRCDVVREAAGWHAMAFLWLTVPDEDLPAVGHRLGAWAETRMCAAVASAANLVLIVNLRTSDHLSEILARLFAAFPRVVVSDRRLVLRQVKIYGRMLDETGRSRGVIPPDPWPDKTDGLGGSTQRGGDPC